MLPSWKTVLGLSGLRSQTWQWLLWAHILGRAGKNEAHVSGICRLRKLGEKSTNSGGRITQCKNKPHRVHKALTDWPRLPCPTPLLCLQGHTRTLLSLITSLWSHSILCRLSTTHCLLFLSFRQYCSLKSGLHVWAFKDTPSTTELYTQPNTLHF